MQVVYNTIAETNMVDDCPFVPNVASTSKPFIEANTDSMSLNDIKTGHIIPVFAKDNEPTISQADFIEAISSILSDVYSNEPLMNPSIRVSHPIKGRIPEARNKPATQLLEHEKTLYYERMAFAIEIPTISAIIEGNRLNLVAGGIKAYNLDNLYAKKGTDEHFKVFIGFQNTVCTNLCVWTDGYKSDLKVTEIGQLKAVIRNLFERYNASMHLFNMEKLTQYHLTEQQFAQMIGRCRMFNYLPSDKKREISPMLLSDTQIGAVVKDYYRDYSFCKSEDGNINLWRLYNLLTGANKSSYVDTFLDRSVNAYSFVESIRWGLDNRDDCWYLN